MFRLWGQPGVVFSNGLTNRKLVWYSLLPVIMSMLVVGMISVQLLEVPMDYRVITTVAIVGAAAFPLYYILNGVLTALLSLLAIFVKADLSFKRLYALMINVIAIPFLFSSLLLMIVLQYNNIFVVVNGNNLQLIVLLLSLRLFYYGSVLYIQLARSFVLGICGLIFSVQLVVMIAGVLRYAA